jgi:L-lactate dehydrogenase complex protein LldG
MEGASGGEGGEVMTGPLPDTKSARARILGNIRIGLAVTGQESDRKAAVAERLKTHAQNLIPARARQPQETLVKIFREYLEGQSATVVDVASAAGLPSEIAGYLRGKNLGLSIRLGEDPLWRSLPWDKEPALERQSGRATGTDTAGLSRAIAGVAETGTLVFVSGPANPTTINYLPETHLVVVRASDIAGAYEDMWVKVRANYGEGQMPRAVNFISGPSRTADIEQQLVMGAHGPRRLHVMILGDE